MAMLIYWEKYKYHKDIEIVFDANLHVFQVVSCLEAFRLRFYEITSPVHATCLDHIAFLDLITVLVLLLLTN